MERAKVMVSELELRKWAGLAVNSQAADWREKAAVQTSLGGNDSSHFLVWSVGVSHFLPPSGSRMAFTLTLSQLSYISVTQADL